MSAQAYVIFNSSSKELQARAGFDGWVMLLRDDFDTEDQAWPQEKLRLTGIAKRKLRRLEHGGVLLDVLQLVYSANLLLEPPPLDREEERVWALEFFRTKMYDYVVRAPTRAPPAALATDTTPQPPPTVVPIPNTRAPRPRTTSTTARRARARPPPCSLSPLFGRDLLPCLSARSAAHVPRLASPPLAQTDDVELVERLSRFQQELMESARSAAQQSSAAQLDEHATQSARVQAAQHNEMFGAAGRSPDGRPDFSLVGASPRAGLATGSEEGAAGSWEGAADVAEEGAALPGGEAAAKPGAGAAASPPAPPPRRPGGGAFLPILPLGFSDRGDASVERDFLTSASVR